MKTVVDIDEKLLAAAEKRAVELGQPLDRVLEAALRTLVLPPQAPVAKQGKESDVTREVAEDHAFFLGLEEARGLWNLRRESDLPATDCTSSIPTSSASR